MRKSSLGMIAAMALVAVACGRDPKSSQMAALDEAYKSGVLTRSEYEAKKAALAGGGPLAALEDAYRSGVLTKAEYDAKRAALVVAPPPSPAPAPSPTPSPMTASAPVSAPANPANVAEAAPAAAQAAAPGPAQRGNYLVMKKIAVYDQSGFERPIVTATMLLPADWQYQGATKWNLKDACTPTTTSMQSSGPDGRGFETFPNYSWTWADDPRPLQMGFQQKAQTGMHACDVMQPMRAGDFARRILPRIRPNAQVVAMEPMPKVLQVLQQQARQTEQSAMQYRLTQRVQPDIVRVRLRYNLNGQSMEEWLIVNVTVTATLGPSMNMATGQMTQAYSYNCNAMYFAERAPQGQLDASEKFFDMLVATIRVNPEWQNRMNGVSAANFKTEHDGIAARSAITTKLGNDLSEIRRQQYANQTRSEDHVFNQFSQTTLGVETYRNPASGETWDLSNQYGHAWVNNRNEIVLSDQEGWDPNVVLKGDWTALQRVRQ